MASVDMDPVSYPEPDPWEAAYRRGLREAFRGVLAAWYYQKGVYTEGFLKAELRSPAYFRYHAHLFSCGVQIQTLLRILVELGDRDCNELWRYGRVLSPEERKQLHEPYAG